jgi:hypothetical protein
VTYYADGSPYSYVPGSEESVVNVGWLAATHPYSTGDVAIEIVHDLLRIVARHPVNRMRGWHRCDLCAEPAYPVCMGVDSVTVNLGDADLRVRGRDGTIYAAPSLIAHYIAEHNYAPPDEFLVAVRDGGERIGS